MQVVHLTDSGQLDALYRFRRWMYVDVLGWLSSNDEVLVDAFDDTSFNYAAFDDSGAIVGSIRVVPDLSVGLPMERCAPLNGFRAGKRMVELCRLLLAPECHCSCLAAILMKAGYQRALLQNASHIMLDTYIGVDTAFSLYQKMGFARLAGEYLDPEWNCPRPVVAMSLDLAASQRDWPAARPGLFRFFTSPDRAIRHD